MKTMLTVLYFIIIILQGQCTLIHTSVNVPL